MDYHVITSSFVCQPLLDFLKQNSAGIFTVRHKRKWLTNGLPCIIIIRHLRECWNGRQARLRCVWLRRVGSSPISRTIKSDLRKQVAFLYVPLIFQRQTNHHPKTDTQNHTHIHAAKVCHPHCEGIIPLGTHPLFQSVPRGPPQPDPANHAFR